MNRAAHRPRALITGIHGFTGRYLQAELEALGYEVHGFEYRVPEGSANVHQVDLCDREAMRAAVEAVQPQVVAHLKKNFYANILLQILLNA